MVVAWIAIGLYPLGIPALYSYLLYQAKDAIVEDRPNDLSKALAFLHRDMEPRSYWWEMVEVTKKARPDLLLRFSHMQSPQCAALVYAAALFGGLHGPD